MENVEGKVAFITGGGNGMGLGMAKAFVNAGMKVVIAEVRQDHIDRAMAGFGGNPNVHAIRLDVTDRVAMEKAADETERVFGKVHILCNNAGIMAVEQDEPTYGDWDWTLSVNLGGVINGIHTFVPRIKKHGEGGHIVNTSSLVAFVAIPHALAYTTSKAAVRGLSESMRLNLFSFNIGVSLLVPSIVNTGLTQGETMRPKDLSWGAKIDPNMVKAFQQGMDPDDVGKIVLDGIRKNWFYIFTAPGFRQDFQLLADELKAALPEGEGDPLTEPMDNAARDLRIRARAASQSIP
jgi:NAD(P)-dependent dehydrogenase (short-subunit alcohol dehydrogenase family)